MLRSAKEHQCEQVSNVMDSKEADASFHVLDLIIGCYSTILGGKAKPIFSEAIDSLLLTGECNKEQLLKFVQIDLSESSRFETTPSTWIPSSEYVNAYEKLLLALKEQKTWPNEDKEEILYAVSFWAKQLYNFRKNGAAKRLYYHGVALHCQIRPTCAAFIKEGKDAFDKEFGQGKMLSIVKQLVKKT